MRLSLLIPAHNEEALLPRTLAALRDASDALLADPSLGIESVETVVADDSSTDRTAAVAAEAGARVVRIERRQISAARNAAVCAATGDALVFVDADTVVPPATLRAAVLALRSGAAGGGALPTFDGEVPRYATLLMPVLTVFFRLGRATGGCFLFCTRAAFDASGGFDETLFASEEVWFCRAVRRRAGRFVVLRETVVTSGRKLRAYSPWELLAVILSFGLRPWRLRRRDGLDLWYGPRRPDPAGP